MTFEEFKKELIHRVRTTEVNQFLHLYIKAQSWSDVLKGLKSSGYYEWSFANGVIDFDLLNEIPEAERESEGLYDRQITLNDVTTPIFLLNNGDLTINQNLDSRCKIVMFGNSKLNVTLNENSMIELEQYHNSQSQIMTNDNSFLHGIFSNDAVANMQSLGYSTIKSIQYRKSKCTATVNENSFLNAITEWFSELTIYSQLENYKITQREKSTITINKDGQQN